ncbi:TetR/AcrR family transcriptional regulator [Mycobacterium riyadhense]
MAIQQDCTVLGLQIGQPDFEEGVYSQREYLNPFSVLNFDSCQICFWPAMVQSHSVERPDDAREAAPRNYVLPTSKRRGDKQRQAILQAVRELLAEVPFAELSVTTITDRAGVTRSGFYFYFESKFSVLTQIMAEAAADLTELTQYFASRQPGESPEEFTKRMVGAVALVYAHNHPVMTACNSARHSDRELWDILEQLFDGVVSQLVGLVEAEVSAGTAHPISEDLPVLIRSLTAYTALMLTGDPLFVGRDDELARRVRVLEQMWLNALWPSR